MPHNAGYYHAAYIIAALVYGAYALSISWRARAVRRRLGRPTSIHQGDRS